VRDISRGGIALMCGRMAPPGTEVKVGLPAGGSVFGRVVRSQDGIITVVFRQSETSLASVDRAVEAIRQKAILAAA
jgi:hypothetical protein